MSPEPTGYCWHCAHPVAPGLLFCPKKKCEELWKRKQERQIRKGKKDGYGAAGSIR